MDALSGAGGKWAGAITAEGVAAFVAAFDRLLAEQLRDLSIAGLDFDIEVTGFEMAEIDLRIRSLDDVAEQGDDPADVRLSTAGSPISSPPPRNPRHHSKKSRMPDLMREALFT